MGPLGSTVDDQSTDDFRTDLRPIPFFYMPPKQHPEMKAQQQESLFQVVLISQFSSSPCDHLDEDTCPKITSKLLIPRQRLKADRLREELSDQESLEEVLPLFCPL